MALDVNMTVHAMGMVNKKFGNIFIIFPLFFVFFCKKTNSTDNLITNVKKNQDSIITNINVKFAANGSFSLNTLVKHQVESFTLYGRKNNEMKKMAITLSKPTVFTSYRIENNETVVRQYISYGIDTLRFEFNKATSLFIGNFKNNILNLLFPENENFHLLDKPSDPDEYLNSLDNLHQLRIRKLNYQSSKLDSVQLAVLHDYLTLYYYHKMFNIDYSKIISPYTNEKLMAGYTRLIDNVELLDKLNTVLTKQIIYNVLRFIAYQNQKQTYESINLLDKKLINTEAMNGFLIDLLKNSENTLSSAAKTEIKKYMKKDPIAKKQKALINITPLLLKQSIENQENKVVEIQEILSTTTENLVFVDLWATWCAPCIQENPYWENAKSKYRGKIKFVKISIDTNKSTWEKHIKTQQNMDNNFIITDPKHQFIKEFNIHSIPRFLLFNKHFQIISDDFVRPSDENFSKEIEKHIKQ